MWAVVVIMALAGAAGGVANWILNSGVEASRPDAAGEADINPTIQFGMIGYIVVGVVAAFTVPLFLSLAQSDLMAKVLQDPGSLEDRMVFAGFCIIAAFSSRAFMSSVSAALIKEVREVEKRRTRQKQPPQRLRLRSDEAEERVEEIADNVGSAATIGEAPATEAALEAQDVCSLRCRPAVRRREESSPCGVQNVIADIAGHRRETPAFRKTGSARLSMD